MQIMSLNNATIKEYRKLLDKKGRAEARAFIIEGVRMVGDALKSRAQISAVIFDRAKLAKFEEIIDTARRSGIDCIESNEKVLSALSDTCVSQGIAAVCPFITREYVPQPSKKALVVLLDGLQDPGNIGTIIRTAEAAGAQAVILSEGSVDIYNPKLIRATMGSFFRIPVLTRNLPEAIRECKRAGFEVIAAAVDGGNFYDRQASIAPKAVVIGSEASGISPDVAGLADKVYRLPIDGGAESLNAAVAAGIFIYDLKNRS